MTTAIKVKALSLLIVIVVLFGVVFSAAPNIAYAEEALNFDTTNVLDDLKSSSDGGEAFNLNDYPFDESKDIQMSIAIRTKRIFAETTGCTSTFTIRKV